MRRRLVWGLTALATALVFPVPASSGAPADGAPKIHFAGIDRSVPPGSGPIQIPRLVRPGSDRRLDGGGSGVSGHKANYVGLSLAVYRFASLFIRLMGETRSAARATLARRRLSIPDENLGS